MSPTAQAVGRKLNSRAHKRGRPKAGWGFGVDKGGSVAAMTKVWMVFLAVASIIGVYIFGFILWVTWTKQHGLFDQVATTLLVLSSAWAWTSTWGWTLTFRKVKGTSSTRLLLGPRPDHPVEQAAWKWGRQFRYAILAVLLCLAILAFRL